MSKMVYPGSLSRYVALSWSQEQEIKMYGTIIILQYPAGYTSLFMKKKKIWLVVDHHHNWSPEDSAKCDLSYWFVWIILHRVSLGWVLLGPFTLFLFLVFCPPYWIPTTFLTVFVIKPWENVILAFPVDREVWGDRCSRLYSWKDFSDPLNKASVR